MKKAIAAMCVVVASGAGCAGNGGKLPPCPAPNIRAWCRCEIAQSTQERAAAGLPVACTIPFVATMCADPSLPGGLMEFLRGLDKITPLYSAPGGWPPYVTVGDRVFWLRCPAKTADGKNSDCVWNGQPGNPWPTLPVADLDSANPIGPGLRPQGLGGGVSGVGGGPAEGGDCALCLASAPCSGLTQDQCVTMHCAAVCPWDDTATTCQSIGGTSGCAVVGAPCDMGATCCAGLVCTGSDVGAFCMPA